MIKATVGRRDRFHPHEQELAFRAALYDAWQLQLHQAVHALKKLTEQQSLFRPSPSEIPQILNALAKHFAPQEISPAIRHAAAVHLADTLAIGKRSVDTMFRAQTGRDPLRKDVGFGLVFGLTEDHALQALVDQVALAAGGFWDEQMSDAVRTEIESWFSGELTRDEFVANLQSLVNTRLSIEGAASLPGSYFDGLAEHYVVRARNIGSIYRGKALGARSYAIVNPRDSRTSSICNELSRPGLVFHMAAAETRVAAILGARSQSELKAVAPFLTAGTASSDSSPVPPLHWRCRSWMKFIFEGLS